MPNPTELAREYAMVLLGVAGLVGVLALTVLAVWARRTRRPLRPIALAVSMNLALLLNAEGMWVIAVDQLHLPKLFAVLVFAVFEICFLTATSLAGEQYRRTTVYDEDGMVVSPGHPGSMLYVAALIAALSGVIVASNAVTGTEKLLRLAVPCVIFLMWWAALTAAGQKARRNSFAYSPRRLAERWGWLIPDDDPDLARMAAERRLDRMAMLAYRLHNGNLGPRRRERYRRRLSRMSLRGTAEMLTEVQRRVALAVRAEELTSPAAISRLNKVVPPSPVPEAAPVSPPPATSATTATAVPLGVPRTAAAYKQWLVIWQDMLADPAAGNRTLAERHDVAGRTITNIRRAGREGALTPERLAELEQNAAAAERRQPAFLH
ncbi:hypothetical protein ACTI_37660 [Actinoplanes sp. OR16]|uniref:hypothetical protein n=1 Tax=Actinoplanes sp. OR16 TaxID=946334 RepID=UPI000F71F11B|nr:hypothetical protein [Actinoplanes sp. OR16]BBH67081.1 hypothetical protein ACTI_37660 [Actinoplanes sp. OR16]